VAGACGVGVSDGAGLAGAASDAGAALAGALGAVLPGGGGAASGVTVTVCVTVTGAGTGGAGGIGSADALAPANPMTAADPAARPPITTRQLRAFLFIVFLSLFRTVGPALSGMYGPLSEPHITSTSVLRTPLEPTWNQPLTTLLRNRYRAVAYRGAISRSSGVVGSRGAPIPCHP